METFVFSAHINEANVDENQSHTHTHKEKNHKDETTADL